MSQMAAKYSHKCMKSWASLVQLHLDFDYCLSSHKKMLNLHQKGTELGPGEDISPSK